MTNPELPDRVPGATHIVVPSEWRPAPLDVVIRIAAGVANLPETGSSYRAESTAREEK